VPRLFEEDAGVYEKPHLSPSLHSDILCCSSTEAYCSRKSFRAPAQSNLGLLRGCLARFSSKNSTKGKRKGKGVRS
jgi:hypothetical protein